MTSAAGVTIESGATAIQVSGNKYTISGSDGITRLHISADVWARKQEYVFVFEGFAPALEGLQWNGQDSRSLKREVEFKHKNRVATVTFPLNLVRTLDGEGTLTFIDYYRG